MTGDTSKPWRMCFNVFIYITAWRSHWISTVVGHKQPLHRTVSFVSSYSAPTRALPPTFTHLGENNMGK